MPAAELATPLAAMAFALLGAGHCVAMCGGIAAALALQAPDRSHAALHQLGKLIGYTLLGAAAGAIGAGAFAAADGVAAGQLLRGIAGLVLALLGVRLLLALPAWPPLERLATRVWRGSLAPLAQRLMRTRSAAGALALGVVWGWLPCGLTWTALIGAATTGHAASGALLMAAFGLGTLPALGLGAWLAAGWRPTGPGWRRISGALLFVAGLWTAYAPWSGAHAAHGAAHEHHAAP
jgi:sulfite exporter TauE/SafE